MREIRSAKIGSSISGAIVIDIRADSRLVPNQRETSLQSNPGSHWLGANLESALDPFHTDDKWCIYVSVNWIIIVSGDWRQQAITWTKDDVLSTAPQDQTSLKFESDHLHRGKFFRKRRLQTGGHFVSVSIHQPHIHYTNRTVRTHAPGFHNGYVYKDALAILVGRV